MKRLKINASKLDMTKTLAETLAAYDEIKINCALALVTEGTRKLLAQYPVSLNAASVLDVPEGCRISTVNGEHELSAGGVAGDQAMLIVNGALRIGPDAKDALAGYLRVLVNGRLIAPEGLSEVGKLDVNGVTIRYPDDHQLVDGDLTIDARFIRRAAQGSKYFVTGKVLMTEPGLDLAALLAKELAIRAGEAVLLSAYDEASDMLPARANVVLVPDGYGLAVGGLRLDESALLRYGPKLYVVGDLLVPAAAEGLAERLDHVIVTGQLTLPESGKAAWLPKVVALGAMKMYKGELIMDESQVAIGRSLLESCPAGLTLMGCAHVEIDREIPVPLLSEKLHGLVGCAHVSCSKAQLGVLLLRATDCAYMGAEDEESADAEDWISVNAASYAL